MSRKAAYVALVCKQGINFGTEGGLGVIIHVWGGVDEVILSLAQGGDIKLKDLGLLLLLSHLVN